MTGLQIQPQLRRHLRTPRVSFAGFNSLRKPSTQRAKCLHIKSLIPRPVSLHIFHRQPEQARRRCQPPSILVMKRPQIMFLQVDEPSRHLNQTLVKSLPFPFLKPEMFQYIVRFVVPPGIEADEISPITGVVSAVIPTDQPAHKVFHPLRFFHHWKSCTACPTIWTFESGNPI